MADSEFSTAILTSKSPEEVANFLPHSLGLSSTLIERNLVSWFNNYANMLMRYNQDLNQLVANGRNFFANTDAEFGSVDKIWNCVASSVMSQITVNDLLIRAIRNDIIVPFNSAFKSDFKYQELLINSQELVEMHHHLHDSDGEYNWNVKAPAILSNFENYKRYEKDLLFSGFLSYLNTYNAKTSSVLGKNENAVNYILKEFNLDAEMQKYVEYVKQAHAPAATLPPPPPPADKHARGQQSRPSVASTPSTGSAETKRKSKLRSKMGSILGRKKKNSPLKSSETIPEDHSITSAPSRQATRNSVADTRSSIYAHNANSHSQAPPQEPSRALGVVAGSLAGAAAAGTAIAAAGAVGSSSTPEQKPESKFAGLLAGMDSKPLQPTQPAIAATVLSPEKELPDPHASLSNEPVRESAPQPAAAGPFSPEEGEANLVKYTSSEDDSDGPTDINGNRMSMLQAHDLDHPPKLDTDSDFRSRNTSSGKYSFEYGDEEHPLSAKQTPKSVAAPTFPDVPAQTEEVVPPQAEVPGQFPSGESTISGTPAAPIQNSVRPPPPPPPSRKVHNSVGEVPTGKRDASSLTFQSLHSARESFIQPHNTGGRASLISQNTGNSLFKLNDYFKHFGSTDGLIQEGLNTSIAEIVNVSFKSGEVVKSQALGEVAFNYNSLQPLQSLAVQIPTKFSKFLLNDQLITQTGEGQFTLNVPQIQHKTLGGVKYMLDLKPTSIPLIVKQVWKFEPHQASLIIKLSLNPTYGKAVEFENFALSASLDTSVISTAASSKPEGSFNKEANRITWRYGKPLVLSPNAPEEKLIARFMTNGQAKESASGIQVKFTISNPPNPFTEILDVNGVAIPSVRSLSTGNYSSHT